MGIPVTDVSTTQQLPLGFEFHEPASSDDTGEKVWVYVYNDDAVWAQGHVITMDTSETSGAHERFHGILSPIMEEGTPAFLVLGVAQHAVAAGSYGFILKKGVGEVLAGVGTIPEESATGAGTICVDDATDASGEAMGSAALVNGDIKYNCDIGFSLENAAVADGALATCYISV
tara:strand:+ start:10952 stop:11473 length:522 start_codon:yes stop_codon:yes gene_type:complete